MDIFIAGQNSENFDKSDWDIAEIPVYLNPDRLPPTTSIAEAEEMITAACFSWSLRYSIPMFYAGPTILEQVNGGVVINYAPEEDIERIFGSQAAGLCRYYVKRWEGTKAILDSCAVYINSTSRGSPNRYAKATIKHELGHACGIHGHLNKFGCVMNTSSSGNYKLTLDDCQMLDEWNPYPVELHDDMAMSIPAMHMPDGSVQWIDLPYTGGALLHSWDLRDWEPWDGPVLDNVTIEGTEVYQTQTCQLIHMQQVKSPTLEVSADFWLAPNNTLILKFAE